MSSVGTSSKKRKVDYVWNDILGCIPEIEDNVKDDAIEKLTEACVPADFITYSKSHREMICEGVGLFGWADNLVSVIELKEGLPSPSNMMWDDVKYVLYGDVPPSSNAMLQNLPTNTSEEIQELKSRLKLVDDVVTNLTEGDATFRVLTILLAMFGTVNEADRGKYKIQIQPTIESHPVFTDCLIVVNCSKSLLIEAKRSAIFTSLTIQSEETAQVLREVQIYLNHQRLDVLPFILTNGVVWSFGIAKKHFDKIEVTSTLDKLVIGSPTSDDLSTIYSLLKQFIL